MLSNRSSVTVGQMNGREVKRVRIALIAILAVAAVLRFWNLTGPDIIGDDATYSFRSVGYFDYIGSLNTQTTPVVWFPEPQWWQKFSFHDAPPLVFAVQWFFFQIFGDTVFAARLPFVIAGLFTVLGTYLLVGELVGSAGAGLIAAGILAISNYHVWLSRIGLLDGFVVLWVVFALYFFVRAERDPKHYLFWGICCGLGLLTKYTFLFMGPLFLVLFLFSRRRAWRDPRFWIGVGLCLLLFLPVVMYNVMVWKTRGHFDAAISTMVGQSPDDFRGFTRSVNTDVARGIWVVIKSIAGKMSPAFNLLFLAGLIGGGWFAARVPGRRVFSVIGFGLLFAVPMLALAGGSPHYDIVAIPFVLLAAGLGGSVLSERARRNVWIRLLVVCLASAAFLWEGFFTVQSGLALTPWIPHPFFVEATRSPRLGYNRLEAYVREFYRQHPDPSYIIFSKTPQIFNSQLKKLKRLYDRGENRPQQTHILVYDDRMDWASALWTFERHRLYEVAAIPSLTNLIDAIEGNYIYKFLEFGFEDVTVILATDRVPYNQAQDVARLGRFAGRIEATLQPIDAIKNDAGETAFNVFRFRLDEAVALFGNGRGDIMKNR